MVTRALAGLARLCTGLGAVSLVVMMLATDYDIVARWAFQQPLRGVVELVEIMVLATAMLGLPEAFLRSEQIQVDLADSVLPEPLLRAVKAIALVLSVALLALLCWNVVGPMRDARMFGDVKPDLGVPVWPLYALILFAFAASLLTSLQVLVRTLAGPNDAGAPA